MNRKPTNQPDAASATLAADAGDSNGKSDSVATAEAPVRILTKAGVCGGRPIIAGTRIPIWGLAAARQRGASDDKILRMYPTLHEEDLAAAWSYVDTHADDIAAQIRENEGE